MRDYPSADDVAVAILTAAELLGTRWQWVIGLKATPASYAVVVARARSYAAFALDRVFNVTAPGRKHGSYPVSRVAIARMVGAPAASQDGYVNALESKLRKRKNMNWWSQATFISVVDAVRDSAGLEPDGTVPERPEPPAPKPGRPSRDVVTYSPKKRIPEPPKAAAKAVEKVVESSVREQVVPVTPEPAQVNGACPGVVKIERDGVTVDPTSWRIERNGGSVELRDQDALLMTQHLIRVWPSVLPTELLASRAFGDVRDAEYRCKKSADRANAALAQVGLRIRYLNKFGFAVSEA